MIVWYALGLCKMDVGDGYKISQFAQLLRVKFFKHKLIEIMLLVAGFDN